MQQAKPPVPLLCRLPLLLFDFPCCCCILFRADCSALLWLLLFSKSRHCPGRPWPSLAVSRFCQMAPLTSPSVTPWGSASRQSAKQAVCCLWHQFEVASLRGPATVTGAVPGCGEYGAVTHVGSVRHYSSVCSVARVPLPSAANSKLHPVVSSSCCQVKWGCGQDSIEESALCIHAGCGPKLQL